jgi:chaperonin GroES
MQDDGKQGHVRQKGDEVVYGKYMGNEIEMDSQKYVIVREADLLGVLEK